jgi:hypothetical protein
MSISDTNLDKRPAFSTLSHAELVLLCETLYDQNVQLRALVAQLTERVAELERQLKQGGSGDPPSLCQSECPQPQGEVASEAAISACFSAFGQADVFCAACAGMLPGLWSYAFGRLGASNAPVD